MDNNKQAAPTDRTTITVPGRSEFDATHIRLRNDYQQIATLITCKSCEESFKSSSLLEIYEHYREREHPRYFSSCLYCKGKVHQYYYINNPNCVHIYHNCLRWRRGENK